MNRGNNRQNRGRRTYDKPNKPFTTEAELAIQQGEHQVRFWRSNGQYTWSNQWQQYVNGIKVWDRNGGEKPNPPINSGENKHETKSDLRLKRANMKK